MVDMVEAMIKPKSILLTITVFLIFFEFSQACIGCNMTKPHISWCSPNSKKYFFQNFTNVYLTNDCFIKAHGGVYVKKGTYDKFKLKIKGNIGKIPAMYQEPQACEKMAKLRDTPILGLLLKHYGFEEITSKCPIGYPKKAVPLINWKSKQILPVHRPLLLTAAGHTNVTLKFEDIGGKKGENVCVRVELDIKCFE